MAALCWSSREEIPHARGKRNPSKMVGVARGHQRADTLKPYSQKTSQSNHTRTTALANSMKLSHAHGATQDGRVMVESSDRMWSTGEGNDKPLQYSCLENPVDGGAWWADTLKPYSQKTCQSNHTRTTALFNSMKLSHARGATQDGWVMVERFDRMWSTELN